MIDKLLFMPYDVRKGSICFAQYEYGDVKGGENKNQLTIDHDLAKGKVAVQAWYNGKKNAFMASMISGQIYIRGHGMPGQNNLEGGRGGEKVRFNEVVDRLVKSGLSKNFIGKIKCYNCHSAETADPTTDTYHAVVETGGMPFAQLVADEMWSRGFRKCTFYGYVGSIDSLPKDGSAGKHKYVRVKQFVNGAMNQVEMGRVSESRFQFYPNPAPKKKGFLSLFKH